MRRRLEFIEDRAVGPIVAVTALGELGYRLPDRGQLGDLSVELVEVLQRQTLDLSAGTLAVLIESQQRRDVLERESEAPRPMDEAERLDVRLAIGAVAVLEALRRLDEANVLIVPDGLRRHVRAGGNLTDRHRSVRIHRLLPPAAGVQRRSSKAFDTTLTEESAIAAPAIIGLSSPSAASGMPITL